MTFDAVVDGRPEGLGNSAVRSGCLVSATPRRPTRRCSGATTIRLSSSLIALVLLTRIPCRVTRICRSASRRPPARGVASCSRASAVRTARTASIRSLFAPRLRFPPPTSTTSFHWDCPDHRLTHEIPDSFGPHKPPGLSVMARRASAVPGSTLSMMVHVAAPSPSVPCGTRG